MAKTYKKLFDTSAFDQPKHKAPALPVAPKRVAVTEIPLVKQSLQRPVATTAPVKSVSDVPTRLGESKVPLTQAERKKLFQRDVKAVSTPAGAFAYGAASAIGSPVKSVAKMKGYKETPEEIALREASRKQVLTPTMDVSRGMTKTPTMIQGRKTTYGQLGEMAGTVAPFMAVESAVSKGLTKAVPTIGALTKTGIAGAVSGGGLTGLESAGEGKTPIEVAKDAAVGSIIGAGANVGLGALGKAITKAKSGVRPTALEQGLIAREYNIPRSEVPEVLQRVKAETTQSVFPSKIFKTKQLKTKKMFEPQQNVVDEIKKEVENPYIGTESIKIPDKYKGKDVLFRVDEKEVLTKPEDKPHGLYASFQNDGTNLFTPHTELYPRDAKHHWIEPNIQNPLKIGSEYEKVMNSRGSEGLSAGVSAVKKLDPENFNILNSMKKNELKEYIQNKYPDIKELDRYYDSNELMEVLGARLAKDKGYDSIILNAGNSLDEVVLLKNSTIKDQTKQVPKLKTPSKQIESTRAIAETQRGTTQTFTSVREGKTPKLQVPKGQRRFTQSSVQKSKLIPEEVKTAYQEVPLHYKQLVNKETFENAVKNVEKTDFNTAVNNFVRKESLKTADDTAEGIALITKAVKNNDIQLVRELTADMAVKSTKAGQAVQALSILSRLDPEGMLVFAERQINKAVESAPKSAVSKAKNIVDDVRKIAADETITNKDEAIKELFKRNNLKPPTKPEVDVEKEVFKQLKLPKLSNDDVQVIITAMNNAKNLEGRAKQIEIAKAVQTISDNIPAEKGEKIKALARISMLANPKTLLARNPLGNLVFGTLENVASVPSGVADVLTSKVMGTARQTPVLPAVGAGAKGFVRGGKELAEDIRLGIDTSVTRGGAEIPMSKRVFENKLLNKANNWLSNALMIGDRPFYEAAYDQRIKELTKLRGLDKPTKEIEQDAMNFAKDRVFQSDSVTAKALGEIKRGLNTANIKGYGLGDVVIPFLKTPANIIEKGVAYTPIGVLNVIRRWPTKTKIANEAFDQKLFTDAIGRFMTGTGIAALGYNMARGGQITGKSKDDPENLKALKKTAGIQDYSIKIGDKWVSFDWAQPAAIPLAVGIDLYNAGVKETDALKMIEKGMVSGGDTLFNQSVLKGVSQMMGGFSPTEGLAQTVSGAPGMFVPTLLGQTARATDPYKRTAETPLERVQLKIPEYRKKLEPQIGVFGEPLKETGGEITPEKLVNIFINPANVSKDVSDPTTQELFRLYKDTGETSFLPKSKIESFTYKGEDVKLTKEQKTTFKTEMGTRTKSQLYSLMSSTDYQMASDDEKVKMASNVIRDVYAEVKNEFITAMGK